MCVCVCTCITYMCLCIFAFCVFVLQYCVYAAYAGNRRPTYANEANSLPACPSCACVCVCVHKVSFTLSLTPNKSAAASQPAWASLSTTRAATTAKAATTCPEMLLTQFKKLRKICSLFYAAAGNQL